MQYKINKNDDAYKYALKIINGEYLADEPEVLACKRHLADLERQNDSDFPYYFDETRADRFCKFFEQCPNIDAVEGTLLKMAEFQKFDFRVLFGWCCKDTYRRRFKEALIYESRGQGKSSACAVVELYVLTADKIYPPYEPNKGHYELNPNIVTMAVDREQTKFVRETAMAMARRSEFLKDQIDVRQTYIRGKKRGGEITAISKETGNLDGAKLNLIICDEFAAHKEITRLNVLYGSFGKREQSLLLKITTAGDDAMNKPAKADYDRCLEILHGRIKDDTYFIMIRQLGEKDNPADFSLYEKCMPMLREKNDYADRLLQQIQIEYNRAFSSGIEQQKIEYLIKRTNRWQVGSESKFLNQDELDRLVASQVSESEFLPMIKGHATTMGYDASVFVDLTAQGYIFKLPDNKIGIYAHGFMPKETLYTHIKTDALPYEYYAKKGLLTLIEGGSIDDEEVMQYMCDFEQNNILDIKGISADKAFANQFLISVSCGRTPNGRTYEAIECPQTTAVLNEACINFKKLLNDGRLIICENELFIQHCSNAYTEYDKGGRMKIGKKNKDSSQRIDLLAAVLNAMRKIDLLDGEDLKNALMGGYFTF